MVYELAKIVATLYTVLKWCTVIDFLKICNFCFRNFFAQCKTNWWLQEIYT
jgi:hypothetical protein